MTFTDAQILGWLQLYAFPFMRIGALMTVAPVFGSRRVTPRVRLLLALALTILVAPLLPPRETVALFSAEWFRILVQEILTGVVLGFVLQIVFEGVMLGGELMANSMGLGFAQLADPLRGASSPVVGQFLLVLATLMFLGLGGHLVLLELLARSFGGLPVGAGLGAEQLGALARFGGELFLGGVQLALPVVIAMLVINIAFGVMSRSAPTLNLMSVGFPATLVVGLLMMYLCLPALQVMFVAALDRGWLLLSQLSRVGG